MLSSAASSADEYLSMLAALASQKQYMSVYLMHVYGQPEQEQRRKKARAASGVRAQRRPAATGTRRR